VYDIKAVVLEGGMAKTKVAKKRGQRRKTAVGHRLKFALCAKLCKGDTACMSRCLKK